MSDKRIEVRVSLDNDVLWYLFQEAHRRDMTLNDLVNEILKEHIDRLERERAKSDKDSVRRRPGIRKNKHGEGARRPVRNRTGAKARGTRS